MGGLLGGGSPTPATYSYGGNPAAYIPTAQPSADTGYQSLLGIGTGGGLSTPASQFPQNNPSYNAYTASQDLYGQAQNAAQQYILGNAGAANQATNSAYNAANYYGNQFFPGYAGVPGQLNTAASGALGLQPTLLGNATNPLYASLTGQAANNPFYGQALSGAQAGAGYGAGAAAGAYPGSQALYGAAPGLLQGGQQTGQQLSGLAGNAAGLAPLAALYGGAAASPAAGLQGLGAGLGQQIAGSAAPLQGVAQQLLQQGFDPQAALFNRLSQQTMDASQAANAAAGLGSSPYGASVAGNNQANFDINWQNQQLQRELSAAQGAGQNQQAIASILGQSGSTDAALQQAAASLYGTGISGLGQAGNLLGQAGSLYQGAQQAPILGTQAAGQAYQGGLGLGQGATNLAAGSAALPSSTYGGNLSSVLPFLSAASGAGQQGATSLAELLSGAGGAYNTGAGIGSGLANNLASTGALPYQTGSGIGTNQLSTLSGMQGLLGGQAALGQGAFALPQQVLNDLQSYLGLGQAAQAGALQGGAQGFGQTAAGIGGAIGGANALFNPNYGLFGGGGGIGSGFGGTAYDAAGNVVAPGSAAAVDFSGGGGGIGSFLSGIPIIGSLFGGGGAAVAGL
jgi:hypothetical protein